jgi:hypothetical protein
MSDLEGELRRALQRQDPGERFTARVLSALPERHSKPVRRWSRTRWLPMALAASLTVLVIGQQLLERRERQRGDLAREQVLEALRLTSAKLDVAYRMVHEQRTQTDTPI